MMKKLILEKFKHAVISKGDILQATIGGGYPCAQGSCVGNAMPGCTISTCSGGSGFVAQNRKSSSGATLPSCNTNGQCN
jgi:hypothetical protein